MLGYMDIHKIIELKIAGKTEREIKAELNVDRKTIRRYWHRYRELVNQLEETTDEFEIAQIQEQIQSLSKYDSTSRKNRTLTPELYKDLNNILEFESQKEKKLGPNKQQLTAVQIHQLLVEKGHKISYSTLANELKRINRTGKECFILQNYKYGDRLEYDFGEVKLIIGGLKVKFYMAVFSSPASDFRWCYLYDNSKKDVFLESHVKFFKMINGVWREVVYDNMRNVVSKFLGKNEKELNKDLITFANYYGFSINVTNVFRGNEKGHVESSVKILRNQLYAKQYEFKNKEELFEYTNKRLIEFNEKSKIEEEKRYLLKTKPPYELSKIREGKVNKCAIVQVENNKYSVPDYLVNQTVSIKIYRTKIIIFSNNEFVCWHEKLKGRGNASINIFHYLKTLMKKPNALKNSIALEQNPTLRNVFETYYYDNPKSFLELLSENKDKNLDEIISILKVSKTANRKIEVQSYSQMAMLTMQLTTMHNDLLKEVI